MLLLPVFLPVLRYSSAAKTASPPMETLSAPDLKYSDATSSADQCLPSASVNSLMPPPTVRGTKTPSLACLTTYTCNNPLKTPRMSTFLKTWIVLVTESLLHAASPVGRMHISPLTVCLMHAGSSERPGTSSSLCRMEALVTEDRVFRVCCKHCLTSSQQWCGLADGLEWRCSSDAGKL